MYVMSDAIAIRPSLVARCSLLRGIVFSLLFLLLIDADPLKHALRVSTSHTVKLFQLLVSYQNDSWPNEKKNQQENELNPLTRQYIHSNQHTQTHKLTNIHSKSKSSRARVASESSFLQF